VTDDDVRVELESSERFSSRLGNTRGIGSSFGFTAKNWGHNGPNVVAESAIMPRPDSTVELRLLAGLLNMQGLLIKLTL
jgi:hypothetical protein